MNDPEPIGANPLPTLFPSEAKTRAAPPPGRAWLIGLLLLSLAALGGLAATAYILNGVQAQLAEQTKLAGERAAELEKLAAERDALRERLTYYRTIEDYSAKHAALRERAQPLYDLNKERLAGPERRRIEAALAEPRWKEDVEARLKGAVEGADAAYQTLATLPSRPAPAPPVQLPAPPPPGP